MCAYKQKCWARACAPGRSLARGTLGLACASLLVISTAAFAEDPPHRIDNGGRKVIEELGAPWGSVGQVNVAGYRRRIECTGALIAPDAVITAAHCVLDPWHHKPFPLKDIHFLAGVRGSHWLGHSTAKCLHFMPDYEFAGQPLSKDVVLITLNDSLDQVAPLQLDRDAPHGPDIVLVAAAYAANRRYVLTAQFGCHLLTQHRDLWRTDCDARAASSGGPIFIQRKDGLNLAAIVVGAGPSGSVAVPIKDWVNIIAASDCP
jgi:protease YdgD